MEKLKIHLRGVIDDKIGGIVIAQIVIYKDDKDYCVEIPLIEKDLFGSLMSIETAINICLKKLNEGIKNENQTQESKSA